MKLSTLSSSHNIALNSRPRTLILEKWGEWSRSPSHVLYCSVVCFGVCVLWCQAVLWSSADHITIAITITVTIIIIVNIVLIILFVSRKRVCVCAVFFKWLKIKRMSIASHRIKSLFVTLYSLCISVSWLDSEQDEDGGEESRWEKADRQAGMLPRTVHP